jgi:hypothetical protein
MGDNLKKYKEENPGVSHKEAFTAVCTLSRCPHTSIPYLVQVAAKWGDAPENPNRGKSKSDIAAEKKEKAAEKKTEKKKENGAKKSPVASDGDDKDDE